ncbi:MAG TPA: tetratricopeptide repeat protein [Candidatus Eisenbacteria bacterium]|nr:tetratricopeptide repeat protein [Candidatus Eisenbacteria bacterium]
MTTKENYVRKFANTVLEEDGLYLAREKMNPRTFLAELKRRHVYRVAIAYAVVAWLLIQVATQVFPFFEIPNWVVRLVVLVSVLGFPISLIIAWAFEMTPQGMKREGDIAPNEYIPHWSTRKFAALIVTIAMLATGVLMFQLVRSKPTSPAQITAAAMPSQKSIAVLPLLNESGDPGDEYFSDGLSEELIAALAQVRGLKVIGRSSSFRFKDKKEESKAIGEKLGVSTLLEGTVRKQGDQVRIVAELINAADGSELWSRTFDRELKDIFAVQSEIAMAVATSLELTVLGANEKSAQNAATKSVEAHNAYLQGHFYFERRNLEDYRKSVGFFDQAIHLDPGYALAYAERSEAWAWIGDLSSEKQKEAWAAAGTDAEKAVAIDSHLAEAHAALGWVRFFIEWKFAEGLAELGRAQELSPWNPTANDLMARVVVYLGQFQEAEKLARQAIELDPLGYQARTSLARVLSAEGKLDEAEAAGRKGVELQPTAAGNHRWQVFVAIQRGNGAAALREAQLEPNEGYRRFELALAHYARGDRSAADAALAELIAKDRNFLAYQIAEVYAWRGEKDKAFEWLQISLNDHDTGTLSLLIDPLMRGLRHDARYDGLLAKMGLPVRL